MLRMRLIKSLAGALLGVGCSFVSGAGLGLLDSIPSESETHPRLLEIQSVRGSLGGQANPQDLEALQIRTSAVRQSAFSWAAQEGIWHRHNQIQSILNTNALALDAIFDFAKFLEEGRMLPPVISISEQIYRQNADSEAREVSLSYTLEASARLVPSAPTWRDYLVVVVNEPVEPNRAVLPRGEDEESVWNRAAADGWRNGIEQADEIFLIQLRALSSEIEGMYRFRILEAMGVVRMPVIGASQYSVMTTNDGRTLNLNDVVYSITRGAGFNATQDWQPVVESR